MTRRLESPKRCLTNLLLEPVIVRWASKTRMCHCQFHLQMLLGGFNDRSKPPSNEIPFEEPLIGCISDVFHNYKRIPLVPESHNALIGMCSLDNAVFSPPIGISSILDSFKFAFKIQMKCTTSKVIRDTVKRRRLRWRKTRRETTT